MREKVSLEEFNRLFDQWWSDLERESFKCEARQEYKVVGEEDLLELFRQGRLSELRERIQSDLQQGGSDWEIARQRRINLIRVHVLQEPLTEYLRFEIEAYKVQTEFGETILLARYQDLQPGLSQELEDFSLFDDKRALIVNYDDEGAPIDAFATDDKRDLLRLTEVKRALQEVAIPLDGYLAAQS